eukprot:8799343-Alexandrium_andersonii.AAC.1
MRRREDARQASIGADRSDRGGRLVLSSEIHVKVARDQDVLLRARHGQKLAKMTGHPGQVPQARPGVDGDGEEG